MICTRCLQRRAADTLTLTPLHLSRPIPPSLSLSRNSRPLISSKPRYLSSSSPRRVTETPSTPTADEPPFSTPFTPPSTSTSTSAATATDPSDTPQKPARSKIPAGALLKGLGYLKNQDGPRAWADDEYPEWLWGLLDEKGKGKGEGGKTEGAEGEGDMFSKSKKQRRLAAKLARLAALQDPSSLKPKIPLQHQSIDLAHGQGNGKEEQKGRNAREELTKTMRKVRRKGIKEQNFLTGMR